MWCWNNQKNYSRLGKFPEPQVITRTWKVAKKYWHLTQATELVSVYVIYAETWHLKVTFLLIILFKDTVKQ